MLQGFADVQVEGMPPSSNTGAEVTSGRSVGVHWYRGTALPDGETGEAVEVEAVLGFLANLVGDDVTLLPSGRSGYRDGYKVGPVLVYDHPGQSSQGVMVELSGAACEELGLGAIATIHTGLGLRGARLDIAGDGGDFTPADVRDDWRQGNVRTRSKVPESAREDRQWRTSSWMESPEGDTFTMGSRSSSQYARCYDRRGFTRFELELKHKTAALAADVLLGLVARGETEAFAAEALGWIRRFVDFVDASSDPNVTRRALLPYWEAFVSGADKVRVQLGGAVVRTVEEVHRWLVRQVAPALALVHRALGGDALPELARQGLPRMRGAYWDALRAYRPGLGAAGVV